MPIKPVSRMHVSPGKKGLGRARGVRGVLGTALDMAEKSQGTTRAKYSIGERLANTGNTRPRERDDVCISRQGP